MRIQKQCTIFETNKKIFIKNTISNTRFLGIFYKNLGFSITSSVTE